MKKIVIVGGGAGGLELATRLGRKLGKNKKSHITLVDRNPQHLWKPLLHELATGSLDDGLASLNYLAHAKRNNFYFQQGELTDLNRENKTLQLAPVQDENNALILPARTIEYDKLIIAIGSISNDFAIPGVKENCLFLDNPSQAKRFHQQMLNAFLRLSVQPDKKHVNIAIVGAGATGVELSAELHHAVTELHRYGYRNITQNILNVDLIEASARVLPALPERASETIEKKLKNIGVNIHTNTVVINVDKQGLQTKSGHFIEADLIVWSAGIKAPNFLNNIAGLETTQNNQLMVKSTLQTTRDDDIFALGDCACCPNPKGGFVPPRAQAAHQMATLCYKNVLSAIHNKPLSSFKFTDKGTMVSLSGYNAVGSLLGQVKKDSLIIQGMPARIIYKTIYRMHQRVLHGTFKTGLIMLTDRMNRIIRPKVKLH